MGRYILRRVLQMIPTVFGVILITFVLFNVVGGSPAAMTLGQHVSPRALEEFDEARGFNRPLLWGRWAQTRALGDTRFIRSAGAWAGPQGVRFDEAQGCLRLAPDHTYPVPLAFALRARTGYRLSAECSRDAGAQVELVATNRTGVLAAVPLDGAAEVQTPDHTKDFGLALRVRGGEVRLRAVSLRRKMEHPWQSQLVFYLNQLRRLDFGHSNSLNRPVAQLLLQGMGPSLLLTTPIFLFELLLSVTIALLCAFFRNSWFDRTMVVLAVALMSINYLVWIVLGQYLLAFKGGFFPVWGFAGWPYLVLPVTIGVLSGLGGEVRFYRTIMLDELYKDYVRTAFAKGLSRSAVLGKHVLKNAMIPIITNTVIAIPFLYTGSLLLEGFFGIPGLGYIGVEAINSSDVDIIRAEVFIGAVLYVVANLLTDLCYALVDPRVKLE